jgi:transcriptional regulator with XRE-family HTH domain
MNFDKAETTGVKDINMMTDGIGEKLRQRRKVKQLSLVEVAKMTGLSIGLLSQIERGISAPSLRSLGMICSALSMPLRWLFQNEHIENSIEENIVVRVARRRKMDLGASGMSKEILSPDALTSLQLMRFVLHPQSKVVEGLAPIVNGAKAGTVISGILGLEVDEKTYSLLPGDSFAFKASSRYKLWCIGKEDCELFWATTPAIY